MKPIILYHGNCFDGFGAAYAAWKKYGSEALYYPCVYGSPLPEIAKGSTVYMIDYSLPRKEMEELYQLCEGNLVVLDHHKTAEDNLRGLPYATFDMKKSGAMLSWEYFHPGTVVPELINYIQDRDLWLHKLPYSKEVSAALQAYPYSFETWDGFYIEDLKDEGITLLRYQQVLVKMICEKSEVAVGYRGKTVAMVNATSHWSEVGAHLLQKHPEADYAASFFIEGTKKKWSLRSRADFDVSVIAKERGGGGHPQASGYVEDISFI